MSAVRITKGQVPGVIKALQQAARAESSAEIANTGVRGVEIAFGDTALAATNRGETKPVA